MMRCGGVAVLAVLAVFGPAAGQNPPATAPPGDLGLLQGYWKPLAVQYEGKPQMTADELKKVTVVFDQSEYHLYYKEPGKDPIKLALMNVSLNPTTTPKSITFEFAAGALKGQKRHGIYEVAGSELKLCYGPAEKPKPTTFAAPERSGYFMEVWARQPAK
jgi:uncharacterized protein (TIGR03067 family)